MTARCTRLRRPNTCGSFFLAAKDPYRLPRTQRVDRGESGLETADVEPPPQPSRGRAPGLGSGHGTCHAPGQRRSSERMGRPPVLTSARSTAVSSCGHATGSPPAQRTRCRPERLACWPSRTRTASTTGRASALTTCSIPMTSFCATCGGVCGRTGQCRAARSASRSGSRSGRPAARPTTTGHPWTSSGAARGRG